MSEVEFSVGGGGGGGGGGSLKYDASILGLWGGRVKAAELSLI